MSHSSLQRIQYNNYGGPELMRLEDFALAAPGKGEVAVRVKFAAINPSTGSCETAI